jgi:glycosyltransferase involved in cell wall biosynthesis
VGGTVQLAGPAQDMGAEFGAASIFVLSSRFEGFPLILIEAMSKGLAVASFDCPTGPSDIIDDHRNGLLVPHKDVDALAGAIRELIEDEALRRACGAAAAVSAREYSIEAVGPRWEALFEDLRTPAAR